MSIQQGLIEGLPREIEGVHGGIERLGGGRDQAGRLSLTSLEPAQRGGESRHWRILARHRRVDIA
jgi:hypothetical protein